MVLSLLLASWLLPAQKPACAADAYHALDYVRGNWHSVWLAKNVEVGRYAIEPAAEGCALVMTWTGAPQFPGSGSGLLAYDAASRTWHYVYVGEDASIARLDGRPDGESMAFEGTKNDPKSPDRRLTVRLTFRKGPDGTVLETWQISRDAGASWQPFGQFRLTRVE